MSFAHASCIVTRPGTREHGTWLREFWLTPGVREWVEVDAESRDAPRSRPHPSDRVLALRGRVGELLAQEFVTEFPNARDLLARQAAVDALRAGEDERRWTAARRDDIARRQSELEDALYVTPFPLPVVVIALSVTERDALRRDFDALALPRGRFVDATGGA